MRNVNIEELKNDLNACLTYAKAGEEIILRDHNQAIARLVPIPEVFHTEDLIEEPELTGSLRLPQKRLDHEEFFKMPIGASSGKSVTEALLEEREENW